MRVDVNNAKSARITIDYVDINGITGTSYRNMRLWMPPTNCHICYLGCRINTSFAGVSDLELAIGNKEYLGTSRSTYPFFDTIAPRQKIDAVKFVKFGTVPGTFSRKTHGEIINTTDYSVPAFKTLTDEGRMCGSPGAFCTGLNGANQWNPIGSNYKEFWANFIGTFGTLTAGELEFVWIYAERN